MMKKKSPFKNVIWALDPFEPAVESRAAVASTLSVLQDRTRFTVRPAYVLSPSSVQLPLTQSHFRQIVPSAEDLLKKALKPLKLTGVEEPQVLIQRKDLLRDAVRSFLSYARARKADLIVTGTHGYHGVPRLLLGSFAETLMLMSPIPVLVVSPAVRARPIRRILFPTDLSPRSRLTFKRVCALARELDAQVTLLHVIPHPIAPLLQTGVYLLGGGWLSIPDYMRESEKHARGVAERWQREAARDGIRMKIAFDTGHEGIGTAILRRAGEKDVGMVAMGSQRGAVGAAFVGSIAREVARSSQCPVWISHE
jgi:nucleotide-binding universal stress UspA family protein